MALVLSHCVVLYSFALVKKKWLIFAAGLTTLASIKLEPYNSWQVSGWCRVRTLDQCYRSIKTEHTAMESALGIRRRSHFKQTHSNTVQNDSR